MSQRILSDQQCRDVHDTIVVLMAVAGDCQVAFDGKVGEVIRRAYEAMRFENDPPLALLPYHKGRKQLALPPGLRAAIQDEYLKAPPAAPAL